MCVFVGDMLINAKIITVWIELFETHVACASTCIHDHAECHWFHITYITCLFIFKKVSFFDKDICKLGYTLQMRYNSCADYELKRKYSSFILCILIQNGHKSSQLCSLQIRMVHETWIHVHLVYTYHNYSICILYLLAYIFSNVYVMNNF